MGSTAPSTSFRKILQFKPDYSPSEITEYQSERTGIRLVVVNQEGPKLFGFFLLATEIHDDSGAPHTLEHLCFMGSKNFKYKGFLDKLATRAYSGTNAWTATDHTAYTLETAGFAGFLQILPIYLEHLILPTMTDAACVTEVYHIDGEGKDAGVVYSEMQGVQNTASELMELAGKRLMYPEGVGFRYETGGMMEQLRVLTNQRIRDFHREMYQPKNLCLALFGAIDHQELLKTLDAFEESILPDIPDPQTPFPRPWIDSRQAPPLAKTVVQKVEFPEEDESFGEISIKFLGPNCADELSMSALNIVMLYLSGSSAAVFDLNLVEKEQLASQVYYELDSRPRTEICFGLSGVETERLEEVEKRFFQVLDEALSKDLDMSFLQDCLDRHVRSVKFNAETSSTAFSDFIINDYLFGKRDGSTLTSLSSLDQYTKVLSQWSQDRWKGFIKKYIADAHHVSILGVPSAKLSQRLKEDEADRLERQKARLGPDGLERMAKRLEEAKAENETEIPHQLLAKFKVPSTDSIHFINTSSARSGPAVEIGRPANRYQKIVDVDAGDSPLHLNFEHIPSNFARVQLIISTESLAPDLRPLLSIYLESFFNLPIKRNGAVVPFEQVVTELERDTVGYAIDSAYSLGNVECLRVSFQVESSHYQRAISWIKDLLFDSIFDVSRLINITARLLANIPDAKRDGNDMMTAAHIMTHLSPKSISRSRCTLVQAVYLKRIKKLLATHPEAVVTKFEHLRSALCRFANFRALVIADLDKLSKPVSLWSSLLQKLDTTEPLTPLGGRSSRLSAAGQQTGSHSYIVPMATIDSSFLFAIARGPSSWLDARIPALMVACAYLNAVEGPLWVAARGSGLAYGVNVNYDIESGFVSLDVYRSPDAYKAFLASRDCIQKFISREAELDELMLEGAVSSVVVAFANEQQNYAAAATSTFIKEVMRRLPKDFNQDLLKKVRQVSKEEVIKSMEETLGEIWRKGKSDVICTCAPGLVDGIHAGLEEMGIKSETFSKADVASHNKSDSLYIVVDEDVYDLTKFQDEHPVLQRFAGKDASKPFWKYHNESILNKYKSKLLVGSLDTKKPAPAAEPAPPLDTFGSLIPFADPSWYQSYYSPYYNETHAALRAEVRAWVDAELQPYVTEWDEAKRVPETIYKQLGERGYLSGLLGVGFPTELTNKRVASVPPEKWDFFHELIVTDELSRTGSGGLVWNLLGGFGIGCPPVVKYGTEELQKRIIPGILAGDKRICLAITEPDAGSDVANLTCEAKLTEDGKHFIVNGEKKWITNGIWSDYFTTAVRTGGPGFGGVSLLLIERSEGVSTRRMDCQGVWSSGTTYVTFEDVKVPVGNLLGKKNKGFAVIMANFNHERIGIIIQCLRFSRVLFEESVKYASKRETFGQKLIKHPVIRLKLAHMARQIEASYNWLENLIYQAQNMDDTEATLKLGGAIASLKAQATTTFEFCTKEAAQIFGGLAYSRGGQGAKVERLYRDTLAYKIPGGSEEIMLDLSIRQSLKVHQILGMKL
ncbi:hypothetical protein DV737_g2252, partial [Chaetothyriales sp. CBS 132003]